MGIRSRPWLRPAAAVVIVALVGALYFVSGTANDTAATLDVMGFDPDRAWLLSALVAEALAVVAATLVAAQAWITIVAGALVFAAGFGPTFERETSTILRASGRSAASFDPGGWVVSALTLLVAALVVAWAASALSLIVRRQLLLAWADAMAVAHGDRAWRRSVRPVAVAAGLLVLLVTVPVFGDMVNFEPDVHLHGAGAASDLGLTGGAPPIDLPALIPQLPASIIDRGGLIPPAASPSSSAGATGPPAILSASTPWQAWRPSGQGTVVPLSFPAPWAGGAKSTLSAWVYLPPGYTTATTRHYPVVYNVPFMLGSWTLGAQLPSQLDALIDSGDIPAQIVVTVSEGGGPYPDSECADSTDGREWFQRFLVDTMIPYVDANYRTIPDAAARAVMGYSQGGFCAPMLALRNPDRIASSISFSGYYQAGLKSGQTPNAWRPFGGDPEAEAAASPLNLAATVSPTLGARMFFELSASPRETFYGPQYQAFARVLHAAGIPVALLPTSLGHAWAAVRSQLPVALETLARRQSALQVFGP